MIRNRLQATIVMLLAMTISSCGHLIPANHQTIDPASLPEGRFSLDPAHATLVWKINHLGFSTYVGRFNDFDATLDFDPDDPANSKLLVTIETASIDTGDPDFDSDLKGSSWFDVANYPTARFTAKEVSVSGENTGKVIGTLDLKGVQRELTLDVTFNGGANNILTNRYTLGFSATATLNRSDYGISFLSPAIGETVTLEINAEFVRN